MGRGEQAADRERGMVTAELAVSLVTLLLVLAAVLGAARVGLDRAAATSVAAAVAREGARAGSTHEVWGRLQGGLPAGSTMSVARASDMVTATVSVPVRVGLIGALLPERMSVRAVAVLEEP